MCCNGSIRLQNKAQNKVHEDSKAMIEQKYWKEINSKELFMHRYATTVLVYSGKKTLKHQTLKEHLTNQKIFTIAELLFLKYAMFQKSDMSAYCHALILFLENVTDDSKYICANKKNIVYFGQLGRYM